MSGRDVPGLLGFDRSKGGRCHCGAMSTGATSNTCDTHRRDTAEEAAVAVFMDMSAEESIRIFAADPNRSKADFLDPWQTVDVLLATIDSLRAVSDHEARINEALAGAVSDYATQWDAFRRYNLLRGAAQALLLRLGIDPVNVVSWAEWDALREALAPDPDTDKDEAIRREHDATHEEEMCGADCIRLGLVTFDDTAPNLRAALEIISEGRHPDGHRGAVMVARAALAATPAPEVELIRCSIPACNGDHEPTHYHVAQPPATTGSEPPIRRR